MSWFTKIFFGSVVTLVEQIGCVVDKFLGFDIFRFTLVKALLIMRPIQVNHRLG